MNANLRICKYMEGMRNAKIKILLAVVIFANIKFANAGVISSAPTFAQIGLKILNFLLSVFAMIAIIGMLISGLLYFLARGDERAMQKAKRSFTYGIVGVIVALSGLIVIKFVSGILS